MASVSDQITARLKALLAEEGVDMRDVQIATDVFRRIATAHIHTVADHRGAQYTADIVATALGGTRGKSHGWRIIQAGPYAVSAERQLGADEVSDG